MIDKATRLLVLWIAVMGLIPANAFSAEALPPRALARIGSHRFYHGPGIVCAALSPDGRRAASAANYYETDFVDDKEPDAYNRTIVLWDTATGERLREMRVPQGFVSDLAFSANGKQLAASYGISDEEPGVALFDVGTGRQVRRLSGFHTRISHLQFSADGSQLWASEWDGPVSAWNVATGKQLRLWKPPPAATLRKDTLVVHAVEGVLSPDGRVIVWKMVCCRTGGCGCGSVWMDSLRVHDAQTNKLLYQRKFRDSNRESNHHELNWPFAFTDDGKHLMADRDDQLVVSEAATGIILRTFKVPGLLRFSQAPDGRYAVIEEAVDSRKYSRLRLWDIQTGKPLRELLPIFENVERARGKISLVFTSNGKTLLISTDSTLRLFDIETGEERAMPGHRAPVTPHFSDNGRTLVTACDQKRCRWDVSGNGPILLCHEARKAWEADCLAHSEDGRLFLDCPRPSEGDRFRVRVRETATGRILHTLPEYANFAEFSPDATRLLLYFYLNNDQRYYIQLYDVQSGKKSGELRKGEKSGEPIFSPDGRLFAWIENTGVVHLHDAATGKSVKTLRPFRPVPETGKIYASRLLFSPDGERLITAGDLDIHSEDGFEETIQQPLRVFHVSNGRQIAEFYANPEKLSRAAGLSCMACSPDGRLVAVAENCSGVIRVLEIASGLVRAEFAGHRHGVRGLAFSADGKMLASGGEDNVVFLWDVAGTKTLSTIAENMVPLWDDLASEDGQRAGRAIASLLRKPEASTAFLCAKLRPEEATSEKRLTQLIADLNSDAYVQREAASRELTLLGKRAEAALRCQLAKHPTLEMRRRIEDILNKLEPHSPPPEILRTLRAIEVLEHVGTPAARHCLEALARGAAQARQTRDAKTALQRLAKRR